MPKVTFLPMNVTVNAREGESILDVAENHDIPLAHACGGVCACTTCHVIVKRGDDALTEMQEDEEERLDRATGLTLHSRLGCQARLESGLRKDEEIIVEIQNIGSGH